MIGRSPGTSTRSRSPPPEAQDPGGSSAHDRGRSPCSAADSGSSRPSSASRAEATPPLRRRQPPARAREAASWDEIFDDGPDEPVQLLQGARVHVGVVRPLRLLLVVDQARLAVARQRLAPRLAERLGRGDDDDLVEALVSPGLVQERHLRHGQRRRLTLAPLEVVLDDARVQESFEPREFLAIGEDDRGDVRTLRRPVALEQSPAHLGVVLDQLVDDLVARDRGGAVAAERPKRLALPGADAAGDRDVKWFLRVRRPGAGRRRALPLRQALPPRPALLPRQALPPPRALLPRQAPPPRRALSLRQAPPPRQALLPRRPHERLRSSLRRRRPDRLLERPRQPLPLQKPRPRPSAAGRRRQRTPWSPPRRPPPRDRGSA